MRLAVGCAIPLVVASLTGSTDHAMPPFNGEFVLNNEFCQYYWPQDFPRALCEDVKKHVTYNDSTSLPILEMGDRSKPALWFVHGFPDSAALWAPQFYHFCAPPHGEYHCIAVTWFQGARNSGGNQAATVEMQYEKVMHRLATTMDEVGINAGTNPEKNTTLIAHDHGAFMSYPFITQYPNYTSRAVFMEPSDSFHFVNDYNEIDGPTDLPQPRCNATYQSLCRQALATKDSSLAREQALFLGAPNPDHATWQTCWVYCMTSAAHYKHPCGFNADNTTIPGTSTPVEDPYWPISPFWDNQYNKYIKDGVYTNISAYGVYKKPVLFMYGSKWDPSVPSKKAAGRNPNFMYFGQGDEPTSWKQVVEAQPHGQFMPIPTDHWVSKTAAYIVNGGIEGWLSSQASFQYSSFSEKAGVQHMSI